MGDSGYASLLILRPAFVRTGHICKSYTILGGRGGSIGRALASKSNGFHDQRFESRLEHKKKL